MRPAAASPIEEPGDDGRVGRGARGVLIAVPETAWAKGARRLEAAVSKAAELAAFLERRFPDGKFELVIPAPGHPVTRAAVLRAIEAARPAAGELFVLMFSGHGLPADAAHPSASWALCTEELTAIDLARQLQRLPAGVDTVVINDCCYGRGLYLAGVEPRPPMVSISAAGEDAIVLHAVAAELLSEIEAAAEHGASYRVLQQRFRARRFTGRDFHVDARPPERLDRAVLGAQRTSTELQTT